MPVIRARYYNIDIQVGESESTVTGIQFTHVPTAKELAEALDLEVETVRAGGGEGDCPSESEIRDENVVALQRAREVVLAADLASFSLVESQEGKPGSPYAITEVRVAGVLVGKVSIVGHPAYMRKKPTGKKAPAAEVATEPAAK